MKASNLKPERKNAWEIGLDFHTFKNRLNLDVTYYKENTNDQIMDIATPWVSGISTQLINAGNIQNQCIESVSYTHLDVYKRQSLASLTPRLSGSRKRVA